MLSISLAISAVLAILLGLAVLIFPKLLRWAIGIWLVVWGAIQFIQ